MILLIIKESSKHILNLYIATQIYRTFLLCDEMSPSRVASWLLCFLDLFPLSSFQDLGASIFPSSNVQVFLAAILFDFRTTTTAKACGARGGSCNPFRFQNHQPPPLKHAMLLYILFDFRRTTAEACNAGQILVFNYK